MNGNVGRPKRKDSDEVQVDYHLGHHGLVTPSKRMRRVSPFQPLQLQSNESVLPTIFEDQPDFGVSRDIPAEMTELQHPHPVSHPSDPLAVFAQTTPVAETEEKAIVLYKPVNPPLFPGGPPAGSLDFPIKINSKLFPTQKAWNFDRSNVQDLFVIPRPRDGAHDNININVSPGQLVDNRLAVIPWIQSRVSISSNGLSSQEGQNPVNTGTEVEQMLVDEDIVVPMEEDQSCN